MQKYTDSRQIFMTDFDLERLEEIINSVNRSSSRDGKHLDELEEELTKAEVDPAGIPSDVITMNSRVCLQDMATGEELVYTLVFPGDADVAQGRISVFAPIGTAMIGYRTGDCISWRVPGGMKKLQVKGILYQPEAAGDFHL